MSTKTLRKRIALATVVALGAGVLSLVSGSSANAAGALNSPYTGYTSAWIGTGTSGSNVSVANQSVGALYVATREAANGTATAITTNAANNLDTTTAQSFGLLSLGDIAGNSVPYAGTTQTATLLNTGSLSVFEQLSGASQDDAIVVSGGTISAVTGGNTSVSASLTTASNYSTTATTAWGAVIKPNTGVSSMTVALYTNAGAGALSTPTAGTLAGFITVSIAASSTSGVVSTTKSGIYYNDPNLPTTLVTADATRSGTGTSNYGTAQYASVVAKDAYGVYVSSGFAQATATNGAYVSWGTSCVAPSSSTAAYYTITSGANLCLGVAPSVVTASNTVVTITVNGVVVGTKSFTFTGKVAKVVLSSATNGKIASTGKVTLAFADSAGNAVYPLSSSATYPASITKDANTTTGLGISTVTYPTTVTAGSVLFTCPATDATGQVSVDYTNADGTVIASNSIPVICSGGAATYTAKFDKATYVPGDIATLTVTFKDSTGSLAADLLYSQTGGITAGGVTTPVIAGSQLTSVSAPTNTDSTTNGVATYKFIVGSTNGSYAASVDFPTVDAANTPAIQGAVTVKYSVSDSSTSLNDVLKGIVALIASINKQIAALAKLVAPAKKK